MSKLEFFEIRPGEAALLEEFLYQAIFLPPGTIPPPRDIVFRPEIFIYIENFGKPDDCGVAAIHDGQITGAAWTRIIPAYGHIDNKTPELAMSVLPEYRCQGIGTELLTHLFALLSAREYRQTSLSVQKANSAVCLYQRMGYEIIRENEEDYIMVKNLMELGKHYNSPPVEGCPKGRVVDKTPRNFKNYNSLPYNPKLKDRAKELRKAGNLSEVLLWQQIKSKQFRGFDFDRQKIIGNYIVDFYCTNCNVVIEIDGDSHIDKEEYDISRDAFLSGLGITVIHIDDASVKRDLESVMTMLYNHPALAGTPPPEGN